MSSIRRAPSAISRGIAESSSSADTILAPAGQIVDRLRALGYVGPNFGHSDPGLQDSKLIVLEAPEEFSDFAKKKGWKNLAEEFDDEQWGRA